LVLADGDQSPVAEPGFHEDPPQRGGSGVTAIRRFPDHLPKLREQQPKNYINPEFRSSVASGIMPDVEGGILPPGKNGRNIKGRQNYQQPD
jgi:hypothetical protein